MVKLTPAYQRYQSSLSTYILNKIMNYCTKTIFMRKQEYIQKYNISREFFIKIFNLYCSLSFMTVIGKMKKIRPMESDKQPPEASGAKVSSPKSKKGKEEKKVKKTRNLQDFSHVKIEGAGIDLKTLMNDGFPQLKFENAMVIEKLFENIRKEMAPKTQRVTFDSFIELVNSFSTSNIEKKVERFFNLIDEDGNGELSFEEISHLC